MIRPEKCPRLKVPYRIGLSIGWFVTRLLLCRFWAGFFIIASVPPFLTNSAMYLVVRKAAEVEAMFFVACHRLVAWLMIYEALPFSAI